jgi:hypothetical protein
MNGAAISPRLPASNTLLAGSSPRLPATNSLPPGSSSPLSFNFNSLSPVKGLSTPAKSGVVPASDGNFAYRDPRLPANWWVSVEWVGGDLRYGYHSPAGDRLRSPSEVAHYLQVQYFLQPFLPLPYLAPVFRIRIGSGFNPDSDSRFGYRGQK